MTRSYIKFAIQIVRHWIRSNRSDQIDHRPMLDVHVPVAGTHL